MKLPAETPVGMTSEKLNLLADWIDTYDKLALHYIDIVGPSKTHSQEDLDEIIQTIKGTQVQDELRQWAIELNQREQSVDNSS